MVSASAASISSSAGDMTPSTNAALKAFSCATRVGFHEQGLKNLSFNA